MTTLIKSHEGLFLTLYLAVLCAAGTIIYHL